MYDFDTRIHVLDRSVKESLAVAYSSETGLLLLKNASAKHTLDWRCVVSETGSAAYLIEGSRSGSEFDS
jgi:hypothetical protein